MSEYCPMEATSLFLNALSTQVNKTPLTVVHLPKFGTGM